MNAIPELWAHQSADIQKYLANPFILNASDPGTGKTRTCIEVIRALKLPTLILAPKSILACAWANDIKHYAPELDYEIAYASNRLAAFNSGSTIIITNHDASNWLAENPKQLEKFRGGFLIIDESTAFKNPSAKRSKAIAKIRPLFSRATCMSGTVTPQGIIDLWHQMFLVDMGERLGKSYYRFRSETYSPVNKGPFTDWVEKPGVSDAIADIVSDITIRNAREDCMDLPENQVIHINYELPIAHMKKYLELKKRAVMELDSGEISAINAATLLGKLLQTASGAVYDTHGEAHLIDTGRYELVMDLVDARDHSVVVFNWVHQRNELMKIAKARGYEYGWIDRSASDKQRLQFVDDFQAGRLRCLFVHCASAAHGITLTKGCATIHASPTYNAEYFEQVNARIFRGGQTRKTETLLISALGTADIDVYKALLEKQLKMHRLLEILK